MVRDSSKLLKSKPSIDSSKMLKLEECNDVFLLRCIAEKLWQIIDDIDTASDIYKTNHDGYVDYVTNKSGNRERHDLLHSDGYNLFIPDAETIPQVEIIDPIKMCQP